MPKKKDKFYICILRTTNRYNTLKSHKKDAHTRLIILISKLQENSLGYHADLFISRLIIIYFCLIIRAADFFQRFLLCFLFPRCFFIFSIQESCSFLIQVRAIVLCFFGSISLLNLINPATTILYHSSLAISFSSVR